MRSMATIMINGIRLHYVDSGPPSGAGADRPPLVMLHGLGCSSHDWDFQLPVFARDYRVVAPCLRGFGDSDKPTGPYTVSGFAEDVDGLLNALGIERCHLLGFSMGGAVALQAAVDYPQRFASLIVVNSQPCFDVVYWREHLMKIYRIGLGSPNGMDRITRLLTRHCFPEPGQQALREEMLKRHRRNDRTAYLAAIQALAGWSVMSRLTALAAPVLMIGADGDYVPVSERERYAKRMPDTRFCVIRDSRHGTPYDQPDAMNAQVLAFLRSVEGDAPSDPSTPALHHIRSSGTG
jgi:3-oxoadipate enol-lactonase